MVATDGEAGKGQEKRTVSYIINGKNVVSAQMLEVPLFGGGTVLRLARDSWSMVKRLRQATIEYPHTPQHSYWYS